MKIEIEVEFFDFWHCGSGSSGGSRADALVARDSRGLPLIPAKTLKGNIRDIAESFSNKNFINECFGNSETSEGKCYFSNAIIKESIEDDLKPYLFTTISSTKIDKRGLAVDRTLREIEVVIPLKLYAFIEFEKEAEKYESLIKKAFSHVKRIGLNRTRGLGRCEIREVKNG